jgi:hypothetical protein
MASLNAGAGSFQLFSAPSTLARLEPLRFQSVEQSEAYFTAFGPVINRRIFTMEDDKAFINLLRAAMVHTDDTTTINAASKAISSGRFSGLELERAAWELLVSTI